MQVIFICLLYKKIQDTNQKIYASIKKKEILCEAEHIRNII
jgi:hypothetical protein